jgi:hypothetical protein
MRSGLRGGVLVMGLKRRDEVLKSQRARVLDISV